MLENIPQKRLLLYMMLLGLLPILFVLFNFSSKQNSLNNLSTLVQEVTETAFVKEKKQAVNMALRQNFRDADHFYIDKYLETIALLEPEIESLQKLISSKNYVEDDQVKKRLDLLTGPGNTLSFSEGIVQTTPLFQETTETLIHPVEINVSDLQQILARIEGVEIGPFKPSPNRPQMIITDFKLDKKSLSEKNEVYILNLKLLKREFL
jgi:hypothetical protein